MEYVSVPASTPIITEIKSASLPVAVNPALAGVFPTKEANGTFAPQVPSAAIAEMVPVPLAE